MSMGGGFCMPLMMLPNASHLMIKAPHLHQLMGVGMGLRPGTTIPMTPLPAITDNRAQMFHFPNQVPTMHPSHAPFIPMVGNPCTQTPLATGTATNMAENPSQLATLLASLSKNSSLNGEAEHATKQPLNQVSPHH